MRFDIGQHHKESDARKELKHSILDLRRSRRIGQHLVGMSRKSKEFGRSYSNSAHNDLVRHRCKSHLQLSNIGLVGKQECPAVYGQRWINFHHYRGLYQKVEHKLKQNFALIDLPKLVCHCLRASKETRNPYTVPNLAGHDHDRPSTITNRLLQLHKYGLDQQILQQTQFRRGHLPLLDYWGDCAPNPSLLYLERMIHHQSGPLNYSPSTKCCDRLGLCMYASHQMILIMQFALLVMERNYLWSKYSNEYRHLIVHFCLLPNKTHFRYLEWSKHDLLLVRLRKETYSEELL